ncbi:MAG: sigma D regulator [Plesiomonas sp.]|uniref:sigma D regulator n=1 Tax=Plesiomonas sp. TaxID=2486279 RepID=UPI003F3F2C13
MLTPLESHPAPVRVNTKIIDLWLAERKALLIDYCRLAGLPPFQHEKQYLPTAASISLFCARLVDYLSAGHFEIYDRIMSEAETLPHSNISHLHSKIHPLLTENTQSILHFNDQYAEISEDAECLLAIDQYLSLLGEQLEARFALEDKLIKSVVLSTGQSF